jgi:hypothetical protein
MLRLIRPSVCALAHHPAISPLRHCTGSGGSSASSRICRFDAQIRVVKQADRLLHREDEDESDGIREILPGDCDGRGAFSHSATSASRLKRPTQRGVC